MLSVKGTFENGVAHPAEPVEGRDGHSVMIVFLQEDNTPKLPMDEEEWEELNQILEDCKVETGITDLAHQHDHYLYGTPKRARVNPG